LLRSLLYQFKQILAIVVVTQKMHRVEDQNQWPPDFLSSLDGNLLELVECPLDI
jgi:hypothetical protein